MREPTDHPLDHQRQVSHPANYVTLLHRLHSLSSCRNGIAGDNKSPNTILPETSGGNAPSC